MMFVSVHAEVREVVLHNDDIEVEEGHLPKRTPPSVLIVPSVTHDTDNQLFVCQRIFARIHPLYAGRRTGHYY